MKRVKTLYWIFTILLVLFTLLTSVSQLLPVESSAAVMTILKFPLYMLPFLGLAKLAAAVVILIPGFMKLKEWAYAGIVFDNIGATYAMIAVGGTFGQWGFMVVPISLCVLSYIYFRKLGKLRIAGY